MFLNYIKTAFRNFYRQKGYSLINILGLAIGFAAFILIMLYVNNEYSYDKFHKDYQRIYRIAVKGQMSGDFFDVAVAPAAMAPAMVADFPEVESATRIRNTYQTVFFLYDDKKYYEEGLLFSDSMFFDVFSFDILMGDPATMLSEPYTIVLTASAADKYFGSENPMGKVLRFNDQYNMKVTGVVADIPNNSHFRFDMMGSWATLEKNNPRFYNMDNWSSMSIHTYVKLAPKANPSAFDEKISNYIMQKLIAVSGIDESRLADLKMEFNPYLQPMTDIHLKSDKISELDTNGDISYIYTFIAIALFILIIAGINFMNLTTARSSKRAREVGVRKVLGAHRKQLVRQFIGESILISIISLLISFLLVELSLPLFNQVVGQDLFIDFASYWQLTAMLVLIAILVGLLAGSYPAFYLSSFKPVRVIKGDMYQGSKKSSLRNTLVVFQFSISIFLLIGTGIIYTQLDFVRSKKLGFDKEHLLIIPLRGDRLQDKYNILKAELRNLPEVQNVSTSFGVPVKGSDGTAYVPEGMNNNDPWLIFNMAVDYDYVETMGMRMLMGRSFSADFSTDSNAVIINKTLWKKLGWGNEVIGRKFNLGDAEGEELHVIGVVDDFHFTSLHKKIEPFIFYYEPQKFNNLILKIRPGDVQKSLASLEKKWNSIESSFPFDYYFMDEAFGELYYKEQKMGQTFVYFTIIAILIACLGLFGLASYSAEQRTKEIGIRKTLGASLTGITSMLTRDFTRWVIVANIIAWPVAFYMLDRWLGNFAYRIDVLKHWWLFAGAALAALLIAVLTVLYQALRSANANPVDAIKYE